MENITNDHKEDSGKHLEYSSEQKDCLDLSMLALDLSRKKDTVKFPEILKDTLNLTRYLSQTLPANANKRKYQQSILPEEDGQIPIAGSSTTLSLSESNSPKKMKTEPTSYYENSSQLKHNAALRYTGDITPGVTPPQPSLPVVSNEIMKMSVAMPTMIVPCIETSQSFMTHNEIDKKMPLTMPTECSTSMDVKLPTSSPNTATNQTKGSRPFKAYPKNFLSIVPPLDHLNDNYAKFREMMLKNVKKTQGNTPNPKMRRVSKSPGLPTSTVNEKDVTYWEKRRKNNEAAKRSREARRAKEDELAIRAAFLECENTQLRNDLKRLEDMYNCLRSQVNSYFR